MIEACKDIRQQFFEENINDFYEGYENYYEDFVKLCNEEGQRPFAKKNLTLFLKQYTDLIEKSIRIPGVSTQRKQRKLILKESMKKRFPKRDQPVEEEYLIEPIPPKKSNDNDEIIEND